MAVRETDQTRFSEDVLERSKKVPVLVDFWAPWCGPCQMLAPALAEVAARMEGRVEVVKVNVDENPDLAARYGVRGIPAVKLFVDGEVKDEFVGAHPAVWIERWLEERLPREADRAAEAALVLFAEGKHDAAIRRVREALAKDPEAHRARLKLVWMLLEAGRVDEAEEEFQKIPGPMRDQGDGLAIKQRLMLKKQGTDLDAARREVEAHPDDPHAHLRLARALAAEERWDEACAAYIEAMRRDRGKIRDEARQGLLQIFEVLGGRGPIVDRWREEMARILFS